MQLHYELHFLMHVVYVSHFVCQAAAQNLAEQLGNEADGMTANGRLRAKLMLQAALRSLDFILCLIRATFNVVLVHASLIGVAVVAPWAKIHLSFTGVLPGITPMQQLNQQNVALLESLLKQIGGAGNMQDTNQIANQLNYYSCLQFMCDQMIGGQPAAPRVKTGLNMMPYPEPASVPLNHLNLMTATEAFVKTEKMGPTSLLSEPALAGMNLEPLLPEFPDDVFPSPHLSDSDTDSDHSAQRAVIVKVEPSSSNPPHSYLPTSSTGMGGYGSMPMDLQLLQMATSSTISPTNKNNKRNRAAGVAEAVAGKSNKKRRGRRNCPHNRQKYLCKDCGGGGICVHNIQKYGCKRCKGSSICEHNRVKSQCRPCGGSAMCVHDKRRSICKVCGPRGGGGRGPRGICEHNHLRMSCKLCSASKRAKKVEVEVEVKLEQKSNVDVGVDVFEPLL
jgi:hypothetical protein